jgi:hypothetical protein
MVDSNEDKMEHCATIFTGFNFEEKVAGTPSDAPNNDDDLSPPSTYQDNDDGDGNTIADPSLSGDTLVETPPPSSSSSSSNSSSSGGGVANAIAITGWLLFLSLGYMMI